MNAINRMNGLGTPLARLADPLQPLLLAIGLAGRPVAAGLFVVYVMAVAACPALREFEGPAAFDSHVWWGVGLLVLTAFGPGALSAARGRRASTETLCNTAVMAWRNVSATLHARQPFKPRQPALTTTYGFLIGCALGLISATAVADAGASSGKVALQFGPYVHHWSAEPDHNNAPWLFGLEYESPSRWIAGASWLRNSFDQSTEYYYAGKRWSIDAISPNLYVKVTAGALLGYTGEYEDKIPLNHKGVALAVIPALGYQIDRYNAQIALLGTAGFMVTFGMDLFSW